MLGTSRVQKELLVLALECQCSQSGLEQTLLLCGWCRGSAPEQRCAGVLPISDAIAVCLCDTVCPEVCRLSCTAPCVQKHMQVLAHRVMGE